MEVQSIRVCGTPIHTRRNARLGVLFQFLEPNSVLQHISSLPLASRGSEMCNMLTHPLSAMQHTNNCNPVAAHKVVLPSFQPTKLSPAPHMSFPSACSHNLARSNALLCSRLCHTALSCCAARSLREKDLPSTKRVSAVVEIVSICGPPN
jgi:hypothetical protein